MKVTTPVGGFYDDAPYAYQGEGDKRTQVGCSYLLDTHPAAGGAGYGFKTDPYDKSRPLMLDPAILVYCGYIGGSGCDFGYGIAVDTSGKAYVTGYTSCDEASFPVISGPDLIFNGGRDAFVARISMLSCPMRTYGNGLAVYFGASGLYLYNGTTWTRISTNNAQWLDTSNNNLVADFGAAYGVWQYDGASWSQISTADVYN